MAQQLRVHVAFAETWVQFPAHNHLWLQFQGFLMPSFDLFEYQACRQWVHGNTNRQDARTHFLKNPFYSWWIFALFPQLNTVFWLWMNIVVNIAAVNIGHNSVYMAEVLRLHAELLVDLRTLCVPLLAVSSGQQKTCFICHLSSRNQVLRCPIDVQRKNSCFMCFCLIFLFLVHDR